jgi:hypothetical protein
LSGSEREELARLCRQKAEMAREHARQKAEWDKQKARAGDGARCPQALCGPVGEGLDEPVIVAEFIASQRTKHGVPHAIACRAHGVSHPVLQVDQPSADRPTAAPGRSG